MYEWFHLVAALFWLGGQFAEGQVLNSSQPIVCISGNTVVRVQNMCKPGIGKNNYSKNNLLPLNFPLGLKNIILTISAYLTTGKKKAILN